MWWAELLNSIVALLESGAGGGGGSYESIATATPSGVATVSFSSIPSTYKSLQVRFSVLAATGSPVLLSRFNGDTGSNYASHYICGEGSIVFASGSASASNIPIGSPSSGSNATYSTVGIMDIHDYASTTNYKTVRCAVGIDKNGSGDMNLRSGLWMSTSAINSLEIYFAPNFATGTTISLYGIKGA